MAHPGFDVPRGGVLLDAVEDPGLEAGALQGLDRALRMAGLLQPRIGDQQRPAAVLAGELAEALEQAVAEDHVDAAEVGGPGVGRSWGGCAHVTGLPIEQPCGLKKAGCSPFGGRSCDGARCLTTRVLRQVGSGVVTHRQGLPDLYLLLASGGDRL